MSLSSKQNNHYIPRSIVSSSNLRKTGGLFNDKRNSTSYKTLEKSQKIIPKFKIIQIQTLQKNQLDSKYNVYKHGSPNNYSNNLQGMKAKNIRNDVDTLDLPFISNVIKQLNSNQPQNSNNCRDFQLFPNLLHDHQKYKYKQLLSDKQQMKDFLKWLERNYQLIQEKNVSGVKKFQEKQILISSAFGEITQQLSKLSKPRSEIIKMLWNRQCNEVSSIIENLTTKSIEVQKTQLQALSSIHLSYQQQIQSLRKENIQLKRNYNQQAFINKGYVNTLRCSRKTIRKYEVVVRELMDRNQGLRQDNLALLDLNTKMLINQRNNAIAEENNSLMQKNQKRNTQHSQKSNNSYSQKSNPTNNQKTKQLSLKQLKPVDAKLLIYRRLQISEQKKQIHKQKNKLKKQIISEIKKASPKKTQKKFQAQLCQQQLSTKKQKLYEFILHRFQQYPDQKIFLREQYFHEYLHDDEDQITCNFMGQRDHVHKLLAKALKSREIDLHIGESGGNSLELREVGVNTSGEVWGREEFQAKVQNAVRDHRKNYTNPCPITYDKKLSLLGLFQSKSFQQKLQQKARESRTNLRNSLLVLQIEKINSLKSFVPDLTSQQSVKKSCFNKNSTTQQSNQNSSSSSEDDQLSESANCIHKKSLFNDRRSLVIMSQINSIDKNRLEQILRQKMQQNKNKTQMKIPRDAQKHLNKFLPLLWTKMINHIKTQNKETTCNNQANINKSSQHSFIKTFFQTIQAQCNKKSTLKSLLAKFQSQANIIKHYQQMNQVCRLVSLFLNISDKFSTYQHLVKDDVQIMYFQLFHVLRLNRDTETLDIWRANTNFQRLKAKETRLVLEKYFSKVKLIYIYQKIEELLGGHKSAKMMKNDKIDSIQSSISQNECQGNGKIPQVISLNSILLYIIQIYLIEKCSLIQSYTPLLTFFSKPTHPTKISPQQYTILLKLFNQHPPKNTHQSTPTNDIDVDMFYRMCLLEDVGLLSQKIIQVQCGLKAGGEQVVGQFQFGAEHANHWDQVRKWEQVSRLLRGKVSQCRDEVTKTGFYSVLNKLNLFIQTSQQQNIEAFQTFTIVYKMLISHFYCKTKHQ